MLTKEEIEAYNASIARLESAHEIEIALARKDAEIVALHSENRHLERENQRLGKYAIRGEMLELIEKSCAENEALKEAWTDFLMVLKLSIPDIEERMARCVKPEWAR